VVRFSNHFNNFNAPKQCKEESISPGITVYQHQPAAQTPPAGQAGKNHRPFRL
jgi:hypothetical protein